jgi:hypothetical protein
VHAPQAPNVLLISRLKKTNKTIMGMVPKNTMRDENQQDKILKNPRKKQSSLINTSSSEGEKYGGGSVVHIFV